MAENPGAGGVAATGAGLGMGMVAGGVMGSMAASMFAPMQEQMPQQPVMPPSGPSRFAPKTAVPSPATPTVQPATMMTVCTNLACGKEIPVGSKFCPHCGQMQSQKQQCPNPACGVEIPNGFKFCPNCGTKVC